MPGQPHYQLLIPDIDVALESTWHWLSEMVESIVEGGWEIVKEFFQDIVGEFIKHTWHAIVKFVQSPLQLVQVLQSELQHLISTIAHHVTNPFSGSELGFNLVALLWATVGFVFQFVTGAQLPFDVPSLLA